MTPEEVLIVDRETDIPLSVWRLEDYKVDAQFDQSKRDAANLVQLQQKTKC